MFIPSVLKSHSKQKKVKRIPNNIIYLLDIFLK